MTYRMRGKSKPGKELRAIALSQIDLARDVLANEELPVAMRVHETRKHLKKLRALLRLIRLPLGESYANLNVRLRDAGRLLSASRDAVVVLSTFEEVVAAGVGDADDAAIDAIRTYLESAACDADRGDLALFVAMEKVDGALAEARADTKEWKLGEYGTDALVRACGHGYGRARRTLKRVRKNPDAACVHEWRKRVKVHWYHMRLLHHPRRAPLDDLSDRLGHANDLAVLLATLEDGPVREPALEGAVESRRRDEVAAAVEAGDALFAEKRRLFEANLRASR